MCDVKSKAVALSYHQKKDSAPKVVAKGEGKVADKIIALALREGIKVQEHNELVGLLSVVELNDEIPVEAFTAVAEILVYLYKKNEQTRI